MDNIICRGKIEARKLSRINVCWSIIALMLTIVGSIPKDGAYTTNRTITYHKTNLLFMNVATSEHDGYGYRYTSVHTGTLILAIFLILVFVVLPIFVSVYQIVSKRIAMQCSIILTNKGINGQRKKLFSNLSVQLPIDKIDSITISYNILDKLCGGKTIVIRSASGLVKFPWVQNSEEFLEATLNEIEKNKKNGI